MGVDAAGARTRLPPRFFARPIAHRGLHGGSHGGAGGDLAPGVVENSRAACAAAVARGFAIEIDVQLSADGEAIVFHDDTVERLTGNSGPVRSLSAAALSCLSLTGSAETIPTLGEVLDIVAGAVPLVVEIKDQTGAYGPATGALEDRVAALLSRYAGPAAVMSFNPHSVARLAAIAPDLPRGLVADGFEDAPVDAATRRALADLEMAEAVAADFVSYHWRDLPTPRTAALREKGVAVICWTIRSAAEARTALAHSDQITFEGFDPIVF